MARIVLVHGAFNELWGPHELRARWLPALRDGLWHHGAKVADDDVDVCFYGDLFRRDPSTHDEAFERTRAGIEDMLRNVAGGDTAAMAQVAGDATFERTVDLVTALAADPGLRSRVQDRLASVIGDDTRVVVSHSLG